MGTLAEGTHGVYKPKGVTSHDVIAILRRTTGIKKIGHAGTLDPLASGLLVVGIGREATRRLNKEVGKEKEYKALVRLGVTSTTDDEEGEKEVISAVTPPLLSSIEAVVHTFVGNIEQTPPIYSAVKIKGKPAHRLVRKGKKVELKPREVLIKSIEIVEYSWPFLELKVITGPGVYIRSLARDIGEKLGTGAYLAELERTRVGEYTKEKALSLESVAGELLFDKRRKE